MRFCLLTGLALLLGGCAAPPPKEPVVRVDSHEPVQVEPPDFTRSTTLGILSPAGQKLVVGDGVERAFEEIFRKPRSAKLVTDSPPRLDAAVYEGRGWDDGGESFALIMHRPTRRTVLGLSMRQNQTHNDLEDEYLRYEELFGQPQHSFQSDDGKMAFVFWERSPLTPALDNSPPQVHRLMISSLQNASGGVTITVAVGDARFMDLIEASPGKARLFIERGAGEGEPPADSTTSSQTENFSGI